MTVLQLISSEGYFGAESMLIALSQALARQRHRVIVGTFFDSRNPHTEVAEMAARSGLEVRVFPCGGRWDRKTVTHLRALLTNVRIDLIHTHGYKADTYALMASRHTGIPRVSTCHNWPSRKMVMRAYAVLNRAVLRRFDRVATPSSAVEEVLRKAHIAADRLSVVPNGVDLRHFSSAEPSLAANAQTHGKRLIGFAGRLVEDKGGAILLNAAQRLLAKRSDLLFVFAGDGPCREIWSQQARDLGIDQNVLFLGTRDDMASFYASLEILVLPSLIEAMPMCLLEAMAAGVPVIATRVGAVPTLLRGGETGLLVEPGDQAGLAGAMEALLTQPDLVSDLKRKAALVVQREYSSDRMAQSYLDLYKQAIEEHAPLHRMVAHG